MINIERVRELYYIASFEKDDEKKYHQMAEYYRTDYIAKEMLKSFFTGSFAFACIGALYLMGTADDFLNSLSTMDYVAEGTKVALFYVAFMTLYLFVTYVVYHVRYRKGRKRLKKYYGHLKKTNKLYDREEKLKQ